MISDEDGNFYGTIVGEGEWPSAIRLQLSFLQFGGGP